MNVSDFYLLNTFTVAGSGGSPTPVFIPERPLDLEAKKSLTQLFPSLVVAFIEPQKKDNIYQIKYFTIKGEIDACGHATLGAAHALFEKSLEEETTFQTIKNVFITATRKGEFVFIDYPKLPRSKIEIPKLTLSSLGVKEDDIITDFYSEELQSLFIEVKNESLVQDLTPNFSLLESSTLKIKEIIVMGESTSPKHDIVLRSFCPWIGINEDPVTGSIHAVLADFWCARLNKSEFVAFQASKDGGEIVVRSLEDKVEIGGHVKPIIDGQLR